MTYCATSSISFLDNLSAEAGIEPLPLVTMSHVVLKGLKGVHATAVTICTRRILCRRTSTDVSRFRTQDRIVPSASFSFKFRHSHNESHHTEVFGTNVLFHCRVYPTLGSPLNPQKKIGCLRTSAWLKDKKCQQNPAYLSTLRCERGIKTWKA